MQVTIHPDIETQGRCQQKSKPGTSVAAQNRDISGPTKKTDVPRKKEFKKERLYFEGIGVFLLQDFILVKGLNTSLAFFIQDCFSFMV